MEAPKTCDFSAWINLMPGAEHKLIVQGEVETPAGNILPVLREAEPQGINPKDLLLRLTLEDTGGIGTDDVAFRPARFEKPAEKGQYATVTILFENSMVAHLDVGEAV